jgi:SAM domain (Sterile alpha motif)
MQRISDWLDELGMSEYAELFDKHGIDMSVLPRLTDPALEELGVLLEHRRKIFAALSALPRQVSRPAISILLPGMFEDPRTDVAFLRDWVEQSCDEPFEVIVVARSGRPDFDRAARSILRPQDRYIVAELSHEIEAYAIGAEAAYGDWLFITENHVKAGVNCLREVLAFLADGAADAGVMKSESIHHTKIGRAEGNCFVWQTNERLRHNPNHQPLDLRGFAVRRDVFLRLGGLPAKYRNYAPAVFGFRVAQAGLRVRSIERALIGHVDSPTFQAFADNIRDTTLGECIFADESQPQFERPAAIPRRRGCAWRDVVTLLRTAASPGTQLSPRRRLQVAIRLLREAVHRFSEDAFATRLRRGAMNIACAWSRIRFILTPPDSNDELVKFIRMWRRIVAAARLKYSMRMIPYAVTCQGSAAPELAAMQNNQMAGFHELESFAGRSFRWSYPLAEIVVAISAAPHRLTIDTQGLRGDNEDLICGLFVNGHRVSPDQVAINRGLVTFKASGCWIVPGSPTRIVIVTEPLQEPLQSDGHRGRRLGLPFFDFRAEVIV